MIFLLWLNIHTKKFTSHFKCIVFQFDFFKISDFHWDNYKISFTVYSQSEAFAFEARRREKDIACHLNNIFFWLQIKMDIHSIENLEYHKKLSKILPLWDIPFVNVSFPGLFYVYFIWFVFIYIYIYLQSWKPDPEELCQPG